MERKRSLGRTVALGCGGLVLLAIVVGFAGCGILRVVGNARTKSALARLKASGAPTTWEKVIPPPVPDHQNAAVLYEDAVALLDFTGGVAPPALPSPVPPEPRLRQVLSEYLEAETREKRKPLEKDIRRLLADNADALSYARQAAERPKCRFDRDWSNPLSTPPAMGKLRDLSRLASAQAVLRADDGDAAGALDAWRLNLAIVKHLEAEPELLGQFIRYAILYIAGDSLRAILEESRPRPERCRSLAEALGEVEESAAFVRTLEAQRAIGLWVVKQARTRPEVVGDVGQQPTDSPSAGERGRAAARRFAVWLGYRAISGFDEAAMLQYWEKQIAAASKPYREGVTELNTLTRDIPSYAVMTRMWTPVFERTSGARDRAIAEVGLMRTALGLAAYRERYGRYPESLDVLREAMKWEVPDDPFSGKDFVYRREGKGYVLYSLDQDLDDDGGAPGTSVYSGAAGFSGDMVWRMEQ